MEGKSQEAVGAVINNRVDGSHVNIAIDNKREWSGVSHSKSD